ncbi:MAG: HAD-IIB family hydrolase [Gammaproteobacteria bacterium]|nr:HAD-IIB family hydrolase [Gammaproteobacteria bacterium]
MAIARRFTAMKTGTLIFTDLDGTLLDEGYRFEAASAALAAIRERGIPLILTSSKTLAEMRLLRRAMDLIHPIVFENGAGVALPEGYFRNDPGITSSTPLQVEHFGPTYREIRSILEQIRSRHHFPFRGFGDMSAKEVAAVTGLDEMAAQRARQRQGSEPGIWEGSEAIRRDFIAELTRAGLRAVSGGRFLHVMPKVDKAEAMRELVGRYTAAHPDIRYRVIAAGDSPNDADMLQLADVAVVIRRPDASWMPLKRREGVVRSPEPGPAGWQQCIQALLRDEA